MTPGSGPPTAPPAASPRRQLVELLRPYKLRIAVLSIAYGASGLLEASVIFLLVQVAVAVSADGSAVEFEFGRLPEQTISVESLFALLIMAAVARLGLQLLGAFVAPKMQADVVAGLRERAARSYLAARWETQGTERHGRMEVLQQEISQVGGLVQQFTGILSAALATVAMLVSAVLVDWLAALLMVIVGLALFVLLRPLGQRARKATKRAADLNRRIASRLAETVRTIKDIQVFGVSDSVASELSEEIEASRGASQRSQTMLQVGPVAYQGLSILVIIVVLAALYSANVTDLGSLAATVMLLYRALAYGQKLQNGYHRMTSRLPFLIEVNAVLDRFDTAKRTESGIRVDRLGAWHFDGVGYTYPDGTVGLASLDLIVQRGELVGLAGPSGAGKSTLTSLLLRLRTPTSGSLRLSGIPIADIDQRDWTRLVAFVPQEPQLIEASVADNIRFHRPEISMVAIEAAARSAGIHDEIMASEGGYERIVSPTGTSMSGGQIQRISIARALAGDPEVLILDEPTSALDSLAEGTIRDTISQLAGTVTVFVVSHRGSTLDSVDRLVHLENGTATIETAVPHLAAQTAVTTTSPT